METFIRVFLSSGYSTKQSDLKMSKLCLIFLFTTLVSGENVLRKTNSTLCENSLDMWIGHLRQLAHSQFGEDMHLSLHYFPNLCKGTYLEIGAMDGDIFSNTHMFNSYLSWKGILVEGSPFNYNKLVKNRANEIYVEHAVICEGNKSLHYAVTPKLGGDGSEGAVHGIYEFMGEGYKKIHHDSSKVKLVEVKCIPLEKILSHAKVDHIDFFSLDVEGAEMSVLQTINFDMVQFGLIFFESLDDFSEPTKAIITFLESKGYVYVEFFAHSVWMVNKRFSEIYSSVIPLADYETKGFLRLIRLVTS